MLRVERLSAADVDSAAALNILFATEFDDPESYLSSPPAANYLADTLGNGAVIASVARVGTEIVGGLVAYELPKLEQARKVIYR